MTTAKLVSTSKFARTSVAPTIKPMKHQVVSLAHDAKNDVVFDCSEPGTGKTFVRIMSFVRRRKNGAGCLLVLAPKTLLRSAWAADFKKFAPHLKVSVATAVNREKAFAEEADVYITNHDAVKWIVKQKKGFLDRFTDLAIDETPAYKNHTSQRSRAMAKIARHFKQPGFKRAGMTGTPNANGICDIWHQIYVLDGGAHLGDSFYSFRSSVCVPKQVGPKREMVEWRDKDGAEEAVFGVLSDIVVRHRLDDCADIPQTHHYEVPYELPPAQRKAYDQLELAQLLILAPELVNAKLTGQAPKVAVTAVNAAAVTSKLLQVASGAVYGNDGEYHLVDEGRYELIMDLVEARIKQHPLVFFQWKHQKDLLVDHATKRGLKAAVISGETKDADRAAIVEQYQRGLFDVLFAHPKTAAHGLTLTKGTSTIWCGPTYDLELFEQGNKRQRRIGQKSKTEVVMVLAEGTIDEKVYDLLRGKDARMKTLLDLFGSIVQDKKIRRAA